MQNPSPSIMKLSLDGGTWSSDKSITETHILGNVPFIVIPVDLFLGIMGLFLVSSVYRTLTNLNFQGELKIPAKMSG